MPSTNDLANFQAVSWNEWNKSVLYSIWESEMQSQSHVCHVLTFHEDEKRGNVSSSIDINEAETCGGRGKWALKHDFQRSRRIQKIGAKVSKIILTPFGIDYTMNSHDILRCKVCACYRRNYRQELSCVIGKCWAHGFWNAPVPVGQWLPDNFFVWFSMCNSENTTLT